MPIKHPIGDYFVTDIEGQLYVFKITDEIKTWRATLVKSFRYISYHTSHFMPLSPANTKELEDVLKKNSLPRANMQLLKTLKFLGNREKKEFEAHDIKKLIAQVKENKEQNLENAQNIINYLESLDIDKIVTPVKKVADFLQDDLLAGNSAFLGNIIAAWQSAQTVRKKVTNAPITSKPAWLKWIAIMAIIGLVAGIGYWIYDSGMLSGGIPGLNIGGPSIEGVTSQYPTPEALQDAINRGDISYDSLPADLKKLVHKP